MCGSRQVKKLLSAPRLNLSHGSPSADRPIRGVATPEETKALHEEGIEVLTLPLPPALKGRLQ